MRGWWLWIASGCTGAPPEPPVVDVPPSAVSAVSAELGVVAEVSPGSQPTADPAAATVTGGVVATTETLPGPTPPSAEGSAMSASKHPSVAHPAESAPPLGRIDASGATNGGGRATAPQPSAGAGQAATGTNAAVADASPAPATTVTSGPARSAPEAVSPTAPRTTAYRLDPAAGSLYVIVRNDPDAMAASLGHDHAIVASKYRASVRWTDDPVACAVEFVVPVADLVVDPPGYRERLGFPGETGEGAKSEITENFRGPKQLDMARYPEIRFASTSCTKQGSKIAVTGELTLRGVTKPISTNLTVTEDGRRFSAKGSFSTTHSAFGFKPFAALGGSLRNQDRLEFRLDLVGVAG